MTDVSAIRLPVSFYEWQLFLRPFAWIGRIDSLVGNSVHAEPRLELAAEGAQVRDREHARKLEQLDRRDIGHCTTSSATRANMARSLPQSPSSSKTSRIWSRRSP